MKRRVRTGWLAGSGAMALVLALTGSVMGATLVTDTEPAETPVVFTDLDGNGVDDVCQEAVVADPDAAAAAFAAADLDADGTISVTEAAHSGWTSGTHCNHGGYVSQVATAADEACDEGTTDPAVEVTATTDACTDVEDEETDEATTEDAVCVPVAAPALDPSFDATAPGAHGAWASLVAASDAVGGKNCNHGGAVSEAVKKDQEAAKAARDAARAERAAEREAAKAERDAAKAERAAAREQRAQDRAMSRAGTSGGNGKSKGH